MRYHNVENSYDIIKDATRGKEINEKIIIEKLKIILKNNIIIMEKKSSGKKNDLLRESDL